MTVLEKTKKSTNVRIQNRRTLILRGLLQGGMGLLSSVAPNLVVSVVERMIRSPRRFLPPSREQACLANSEHFLVRAGRHTLSCWRWGNPSAPTIALIHGWEGRGAQLGAFIEPLLRAGKSVVAFDAPGHGSSPGRSCTLPDFIDALWALHRHQQVISGGEARALVGAIGHSLGTTALALAIAEGLPVDKAVLLAPPSSMYASVEIFGQHVGLSDRACVQLRRALESRFHLPWDQYFGNPQNPVRNLPLLLVHDRYDRDVPFSEGQRLADTLQNSVLFATEGLGHRRILQDPVVIEKVTQFMCSASTCRYENSDSHAEN